MFLRAVYAIYLSITLSDANTNKMTKEKIQQTPLRWGEIVEKRFLFQKNSSVLLHDSPSVRSKTQLFVLQYSCNLINKKRKKERDFFAFNGGCDSKKLRWGEGYITPLLHPPPLPIRPLYRSPQRGKNCIQMSNTVIQHLLTAEENNFLSRSHFTHKLMTDGLKNC